MSWLQDSMPTYFFDAMRDEPDAMAILEREVGTLKFNQQLILADRPNALIVATRNVPGSLYEVLTHRAGSKRAISYAMFAHSTRAMPEMEQSLEIQRFEFDCKSEAEIAVSLVQGVSVPAEVRDRVNDSLHTSFVDFDMSEFDRLLGVLWLNNASYVRVSPARRVAQTLRMLQLCERMDGLYLDVEPMDDGSNETRVSFAVGIPPHRGYLAQLVEALNRLDLGLSRAYVLHVATGTQPYGLFALYVRPRKGGVLEPGSALHSQLERELFNTQILSADSPEYREFVTAGMMSGEDASLVRALVAFCHTQLAHNNPDRFDWQEVRSVFHDNVAKVLQLVQLFRLRFDPANRGNEGNQTEYQAALAEAGRAIEEYNTGHKLLDDRRRDVFRCCLAFIRNTLKTNFFVKEKQALSFRLDPVYLAQLGPEFTGDLPSGTPFRVTFFFTGYGFGYHIGFSDIARGGWRTVISRTHDDFLTAATTLFRENFVLAHTQHFKNKDIYEGGSKLVMLMDASSFQKEERKQEALRLYKLQRDVIHAFLDIYVTEDGVAKHPNVVDYYRQDEPIELGPDENMHDNMIEEIAQISKRRGYVLGIGLMSSKTVGINHKEYGVTSIGVVKFVEITMHEIGIDVTKDPFSVKFTGGPNGDVAGNAMNIMLGRCPKMQIRMIRDFPAVLVDPEGVDLKELRRIVLKQNLDAFDPNALHAGGYMLFRTGTRHDGLRVLHRKVTKTTKGLEEEWISIDEFERQVGVLAFSVVADLFIPGGGRPEEFDKDNWKRFLQPDGQPSSRVIIEGANSFITPEARVRLQNAGVIIMRDASANKCGVISSSYEIIANLLLSEEEFLTHKQRYVEGVLQILERRASDEAHLILRRRRETGKLCTEISDSISGEINANYARLFAFFQSKPGLARQPQYERAILNHLPEILREEPFRRRTGKLPPKYRSAILAAEIGASMVYRSDRESEFEDLVWLHVERHFGDEAPAFLKDRT